MEDMVEALRLANEEAQRSKAQLEQLKNDVEALSDVVGPLLQRQIEDLRSARMTLVRETRESLAQLQEVRKFFLDSNYHTEINRLKEFTGLCDKLIDLQRNGSLDAVTDAMIRLSLKEPSTTGGTEP